EMRIGWRITQIDGFGGLRYEADQPLTFLQSRVVDGGAVQALGGKEFKRLAGAAQIDRADFGHHVGGDHGHELVEARLRARLLRHDLSEAPQKQTWTARRDRHQATSSS